MYIYEIEDQDGSIYYMEDAYDIIASFGKVIRVNKYLLRDPEDITDEVNSGNIKDR